MVRENLFYETNFMQKQRKQYNNNNEKKQKDDDDESNLSEINLAKATIEIFKGIYSLLLLCNLF